MGGYEGPQLIPDPSAVDQQGMEDHVGRHGTRGEADSETDHSMHWVATIKHQASRLEPTGYRCTQEGDRSGSTALYR